MVNDLDGPRLADRPLRERPWLVLTLRDPQAPAEGYTAIDARDGQPVGIVFTKSVLNTVYQSTKKRGLVPHYTWWGSRWVASNGEQEMTGSTPHEALFTLIEQFGRRPHPCQQPKTGKHERTP